MDIKWPTSEKLRTLRSRLPKLEDIIASVHIYYSVI